MRETIHLAVRLMLFALVAAILLAVVNAVTAEPIARNDQAKVNAARAQVLGDYTFTELDGDLSEYSEILGVYRATEGDLGHAEARHQETCGESYAKTVWMLQ